MGGRWPRFNSIVLSANIFFPRKFISSRYLVASFLFVFPPLQTSILSPIRILTQPLPKRMTNTVQNPFLLAFVLLNGEYCFDIPPSPPSPANKRVLPVALLVVGQGTQFITGPCTSDADCASGCCGFNTGKCAGPVVAQERDGGCGFGNAQPNANAAASLLGHPLTSSAVQASSATTTATNNGAGNGAGKQFITGPCASDADCASGCCGFNTGKCAGPVVAQERDGGCGHGNAQPNANAAESFLGHSLSSPSAAAAGQPTTFNTVTTAASPPATTTTATNNGAGNGAGKQFITGPCTSDADCASGCCGFNTGKCAGAVVAQERDGGCGFGNAQPNASAAQALQGKQ
jgi:hypothetical protein